MRKPRTRTTRTTRRELSASDLTRVTGGRGTAMIGEVGCPALDAASTNNTMQNDVNPQ